MSRHHPWTGRLAARWPAALRDRALTAGLAFGTVGFLTGLVVTGGLLLSSSRDVMGQPLDALGVVLGLPVAAGLAAATVGTPLWLTFVERPDEPTALRGGLVGVAVGVGAHPLMWLLFGAGLLAVDPGNVPGSETLWGVLADLFVGYVVITVVSVVVGGVFTVPLAVVTGVVLARFRERAPEAVADERRSRHL